ncbi:MAG TPA: protein kinase [Phycisphaerae bacterium]|nr:protein kinase [Phycisphaerae bacterium]
MAKIARPGDAIRGYRIIELIHKGAMATSYAATAPDGRKVFFKQYKSPSVTVDWYNGYVAYQAELKRRVESTPLVNFTYRMIEFFEADFGPRTFFQVFEFVRGNLDMEKALDGMRRRRHPGSWDQVVILAKILMNAVATLHDARIIHCDLKPANIQLFPDKSIAAGYHLKLIDMDFSILSDRRAPWHGHSAYVGSPRYFSPEHLRGQVPLPASDVFTCGLILHELLAGRHPYRSGGDDEEEAYAQGVLGHTAPPPALLGTMPAPADDGKVAEAIHRCLSPDPWQRPTARELNLVLNGRGDLAPRSSRPAASASPAADARIVSATPAARPAARMATPAEDDDLPRLLPEELLSAATRPVTARTPALELIGPGGQRLSMRVRTDVGRAICKPLGVDSLFWDRLQFTVDRKDGRWLVIPNAAATNETLLNGEAISVETPLAEGDTLAVGRQARGIAKLPLTVHLE